MASKGCAFDRPVQDLANGFELLRQEYLGLAVKYRRLESMLQATKQQYDTLASLAPDQAAKSKPTGCPVKHDQNDPIATVEETLSDAHLGGSGNRAHVVGAYKKAADAYSVINAQTPVSHTGAAATLEQEISNLERSPTKARCPFAADGNDFNDTGPSVLVTPASARRESAAGLSKVRSLPTKTTSLSGIPENPKHYTITPAESTASGPVCPIRLMDKHTPEDIAQYFEEHKHELPRSHEICVKRFQTNSQSIRELDEKYGNLVSMIQGLGKMHKPMLPEALDGEIDAGAEQPHDHNRKQNDKIFAWSKAVSNSTTQPEKEAPDAAADADGDDGDDGREGRFDRSLKDIRVGESPSRPWGVPIPSKYLDMEDEAQSQSSAPKEPDAKVNDSTKAEVSAPATKPKGKCPFDHAAMKSQQKPAAKQEADKPQGPTPAAPVVSIEHAAKPQQIVPPPQPDADKAGDHAVIVNHGMAIMAPSSDWKGLQLSNFGTVILAESAAHASSLMRDTFSLAGTKPA